MNSSEMDYKLINKYINIIVEINNTIGIKLKRFDFKKTFLIR